MADVANRPVHKASYILAILHHPSVTMLQPINLRSISHVRGDGSHQSIRGADLKCFGKGRGGSARLAYELIYRARGTITILVVVRFITEDLSLGV